MDQSKDELTVEELADRFQVPVRTIRYYIAEGLLAGPGVRGKGAVYGEEHQVRLRLIRTLTRQRVPLAEIRDRMKSLSLDDLRALLAEQEDQTALFERAESERSPRDYISMLLRNARTTRPIGKQSDRPVLPRESDDESHSIGGRSPRSLSPAESWLHWELAPGVELHVQLDARNRYRDLIDRILRQK